MKTCYQKVICVLACVFLIASFFVVNVSAADYKSVTFNYPFQIEGVEGWTMSAGLTSTEGYLNTGDYWNFYNPSSATVSNGVSYYTFNWPSDFTSYGYISVMLGRSKFDLTSYSTSDTVWSDPFSFNLRLISSGSTVFKYRLSLRKFTNDSTITSAIAYSDWVDISTSSGYNTISVPQTKFKMVEGGNFAGLGVFIDFFCHTTTSNFSFSVVDDVMTVNYGTGSSPDYPFYENASGGNIGGYESAESELMDSASDGLSEGLDAISGFKNVYNDLGLLTFNVRLIRIMDRLIDFPGLTGLITVSISLGLFASLFGLAGAIVTAADRRAGAGNREAKNASNKK